VKRSNRLVILVGVLLAVLAFVGIVIVLNNAGGGGGGTADQPVTVAVLVATEDIAIGDPVTPDKVEIKQVDPTAVVGTRLADPSQVGGRASLFNVPAGTQVSAETIGIGTNIIDIAGQLQAGERAVGFQVDRVTGLDFLVKPGDHVDVVLSQRINVLQPTVDSAGGDPDAPPRVETIPGLEAAPTVKTVLQNRRVLYVSAQRLAPQEPVDGEAAPSQPAAAIENVIIIFAGTDQDAEVLKFVQNDLSAIGDLTAVVRSAEDDEAPDVETSGITLDILVEQFGVPIPDIVQQLQEGATP
jgi:Flp pilus assembly protein CpaB